ncbi:MAG TPA: DNA-directed RNA polymerase subunit omega [Pyrinomonadaceae bacterium]|nr:DNA-directed RNA polymerase subunit omega [Pyrinomonadaceae bacterium]
MAEKAAKEIEENIDEVNEIIDPPHIDSKYRMILLAAQRSKQLQRGAISRTDIDTRKHKSTRVALRELDEKKVNFRILENN